MNKKMRKAVSFATFLLPALIIYSVFRLLPALSSLFYGFTDWNGISMDFNFVGLENFKELFQDEMIRTSVKNTLIYTILVTVFQNGLGLVLALMLDRKSIKGKSVFRTILFVPAVLSTAVICFIWSTILNPVVGTWGDIVNALGLQSLLPPDPLGTTKYALYFIIIINVWQFAGYSMLIYLSGLQGVSEELYEAGMVDGCTGFNKFRYITLPLIMPSVTINVVLTTIGCLKEFEHVYVLTGGGPGNATQVIGTAIYKVAFGDMQRYGYGIAISTVLLIAISIVTAVQLKVMNRKETY